MQINIKERLWHGFTGGLSYTWSKALGNFDTETSNLRVQYDAKADKAPALFDRRHVFVGNFIYGLPFFKNEKSLRGKILGGWQLSGIVAVQSGLPFTVSGGTRASTSPSNGYGGNLDLIGDWTAVTGSQTPAHWINAAAFTGRVGLVAAMPRDLIRLPWSKNVNMSLSKS